VKQPVKYKEKVLKTYRVSFSPRQPMPTIILADFDQAESGQTPLIATPMMNHRLIYSSTGHCRCGAPLPEHAHSHPSTPSERKCSGKRKSETSRQIPKHNHNQWVTLTKIKVSNNSNHQEEKTT
jgi:hypothetical protein